jgi:hypothetical protein
LIDKIDDIGNATIISQIQILTNYNLMYYRIRNSLDSKIVGHYNQIENAELPSNWDSDPTFIDNINFSKINFTPKMPIGILHKKAKVTDLLRTVPPGFTLKLLMSKLLKDLWRSFDNKNFQFFACDVQGKNISYEYWLLSPISSNLELIDFKKSEVTIRKRKPEGGTFLERVEVDNLTDFHKYLDSVGPVNKYDVTIARIYLLPDVDQDVFVLSNVEGGTGYFVSEKFKNAIKAMDITGIELAAISLTLNEWLHNDRENIYGKV